jgi:beta-N-acetylhexosaminidase
MANTRVPSRRVVLRRRALAIAIVVVALAATWLVFLRPADEPAPAQGPTPGISAAVAAEAAGLTTEELADQVLLLGFEGTDASSPVLAELRSRQLGGVLVGSANWPDATAGSALVDAIRKAGREGDRIRPLIVAAQEGGGHRAFADLPPERSELEVGAVAKADDAEAWAAEAATALRQAGFDLDLFPVADVATLDSPLGDRAFSDDPAEVTGLTAATLRGCERGRLACAALHFPGLGAASEDTDRAPATVSLDAATLESRDLAPFIVAFGQGMPAVVLSLAFYAAYDPVTPAALSEPIATGLLRGRLGFTGVAITDDLGAGAVRFGSSVPKAAVAALAAGADLVRIDAPADAIGVREAIERAVAGGELSRERLEQAAARVLELKRSVGLLP